MLAELDREHLVGREADSRLDARIASYELAAKLQVSAPEVLDVSRETPATHRLYGLDQPITEDFGRNCLVGPAIVGAGRAVRTGLERRGQRLPAPQLG